MKKEFLPYYISRFILSAVFSILVWDLSLTSVLMTIVFFGLFLFYLHSGWFSIDLGNPFFPLRRDSHGQEIQRKALVASVVISLLLYTISIPLSSLMGIPLINGNIALSIGIVAYFIAQFTFFIKA
jgi:hypothetical protein